MPTKRRLLEIAGPLLLLAACQTPLPAPVPPTDLPPEPVCPEPPAPPEAAALKTLQAHVEDLRRAVALGQGRSGVELAQAAAQLEQVASASDPAVEPVKPLATLLVARLAEQRRLQEAVERLGQQLRDSQRRNEQLNEKLEALKAIEQTLPAKPGTPTR